MYRFRHWYIVYFVYPIGIISDSTVILVFLTTLKSQDVFSEVNFVFSIIPPPKGSYKLFVSSPVSYNRVRKKNKIR